MKVEMGKKYKTAAGKSVEILATSGRGECPVVGYVDAYTDLYTWGLNGKTFPKGSDNPGDLVEVPEFKSRDFYISGRVFVDCSVIEPGAINIGHRAAPVSALREYIKTLSEAADYAEQWADSEK